jgi:type VI secretion system protein ImpM
MPVKRAADAAPPGPPQLGFFGKVPTRGDFVNRRLGQALQAALDQWLSRAIVTSRRQLGTEWLPTYLVAPVWRFVAGPGTLGPHATAGVLMPSVDRVGRYFPLVIALELPGLASPWRLVRAAEAWFDGVEALARSCLDDAYDFEAFEEAVRAFGPPAPIPDEPARPNPSRFARDGADGPIQAYADAVEAMLAGTNRPFSAWWTRGSSTVAPSLLLHDAAPEPDQFAALLDGRWREWGWHEGLRAGPPAASKSAGPPEPEPDPGLVKLVGAARSHKGTRRRRNDDAVVNRSDLGLWAVVDGAGGHAAADYAAGVVADRLEAMPAPLGRAPERAEIDHLLLEANAALRARARRLGPEEIVAAVVVALLVHRGRYAVVWVGDSRAYLLRGHALRPLTQDHVTREGRRMVTRAVGAEDAFAADWVEGTIRPGDRFVLCSDGLVGALGEAGLGHAVGHGTPQEAVGSAIDDALIAGARDNISAVVVDVVGADG